MRCVPAALARTTKLQSTIAARRGSRGPATEQAATGFHPPMLHAAGMKVALLGPVAWRTPPRHYGPWEQVTSLLAEGLVARGVDVTLFATLDSRDRRPRSTGCARTATPRIPTMDGRVWEALHVAHALARSAEFDLVHNHLDWLPLAFAEHCRAPLLTTVHGFSGPAILPAYARAALALRVDLGRRPRHPSSTTSPRPPRHRPRRAAVPRRRRQGWSSSAGSTRTRAPHTAIEIARAAGRPLTDLRHRAGRAVLRRAGARRTSTGTGWATSARSGPHRRAEVLGGSRGAAAPDRVRRAVRAVGGGGDGLRHAGGRLPARLDARGGRRGRDGLPGPHRRAGGGGGRPGSPSLDRARCRARARSRFSADRMVNDYLDLYSRVAR